MVNLRVLIISHLVSLVLPNEEGDVSKDEVKPCDHRVPIVDKWYTQVAFACDKATLIEIEELEEKIFSASLQVKVRNVVFAGLKSVCL